MNLAYHILRGLMLGLALPPLSASRAMGRGLGRMIYARDARHRKIVMDNLTASFPEKDPAWVEETARKCFEHIGQVVMEIPHLVAMSPDQILARTRFHGVKESLELRERTAPLGGALLTGHLGNWEWGSLAAGIALGPAMVVARPLDWKPADMLVNNWRTKTGHEVVPKANSARRLLRGIKKGEVAGVLLDQNVDWYDGVWVDFFGRPACTNKGLALLSMVTKTPVVPFHCFRADDGFFDVYFGKEIPPVRTGDKTQDIWQNTQNYTKALEDIIRQKPEQWFWLHQRWKTKPYHAWPRESG